MGFASGRLTAINAKLRRQRAKQRQDRAAHKRRTKKDKAEEIYEQLELMAEAEAELVRQEEAAAPVSSWGLFACLLEPHRATLHCCCCPCYYAHTRSVVNNSSWCMELLKCCFCLPCTLAIWAPSERFALRRGLALDPECGTGSGDHVAWWLCPCCAVCEEAREMRTRKCRSTDEYLKRVQEARVAEMNTNRKDQQFMLVDKSPHVHHSADWTQCEQCCCFCAPHEAKTVEDGSYAGFEFNDSEMPGWVTRSMEPPLQGSDPKPEQAKWHYCPSCGQQVKDQKRFCMTCGNSLQ